MKKIILLVLSIVLVSCASKKEVIQKPFYWKAVKGPQTFHFLGTMHMGISLKIFPKDIKNEILTADIVAVECTKEVNNELAGKMKEWALEYYSKEKEHYPNLKNDFSAKAWERVLYTLNSRAAIKYVRDQGINHPMTELHPSLVYSLIGYLYKENEFAAFDPSIKEESGRWYALNLQEAKKSVMDLEIEDLATSNEIEVTGLDNIGQILHVQTYGDKNPFIQSLEYIFNRESTLKKSYEYLVKMEKAYRSGREEKLLPFAQNENNETLLMNRNKTWFDELIQYDQERIFVAVGAAHLIGENNLLTFFKERGFEVSRVQFDGPKN